MELIMRVPVPNNTLVGFTLAGALLTAVVAGALAIPGGGLAQAGRQSDSPGTSAADAAQQVGADAPTPNQNFTPAVQTQSGVEGEEREEYEDREEAEDGGHEEEREEYEEHEADE